MWVIQLDKLQFTSKLDEFLYSWVQEHILGPIFIYVYDNFSNAT